MNLSEEQQKALVVYLVACAALAYFVQTKLVAPEVKRVRSMKVSVDDLKARHTAYTVAKGELEQLEEEAQLVEADLNATLKIFPVPKSREGARRIRVYDTFSLSEQISRAARGLALTPKESLNPKELIFRSALVQPQDLSALGDSFQDPGNKATLEPEESSISNFLSVGQPVFNYEVSGDYGSFIQFLDELRKQENFFDITKLDLSQKGVGGTIVEAKIVISSLDISEGMFDPFGQ